MSLLFCIEKQIYKLCINKHFLFEKNIKTTIYNGFEEKQTSFYLQIIYAKFLGHTVKIFQHNGAKNHNSICVKQFICHCKRAQNPQKIKIINPAGCMM